MDQSTAQTKFLFHPARKLARRALGKRIKPGRLDKPCYAFITLALSLPKQAAEKLKVLAHRQIHIQVLAKPLRHIGNARQDRVAVPGVFH